MYACIDFDGTIVDHKYPLIGEEVPDAIRSLKRLETMDFKLILFTMRSGETLLEAVEWLLNRDILLYGVNRNPSQDSWTDSPKAYGHIYIDDAAVGCPLICPSSFNRPCVDWKKIMEIVRNMVRS